MTIYRGFNIVPAKGGFHIHREGRRVNAATFPTEAAAQDAIDDFKRAIRQFRDRVNDQLARGITISEYRGYHIVPAQGDLYALVKDDGLVSSGFKTPEEAREEVDRLVGSH